MMDCKHKHFRSNCMVCWFKIGHSIHVDGAPIRGDEGSDQHRQDCINIARGVGIRKLKQWEVY
jgi:hypothetical protein